MLCIAGKNRVAVEAVECVVQDDCQDLVVCPVAGDLGEDGWQPSLKLAAKRNNIPSLRLEELYEIEDLVFVSLEYDKIIYPERFATKKLFNVHFSLLPAYKGCFTSVWPILNDEKYSGVTLHKIDDGIDTGEIIAQKKFLLWSDITARQLYDKYTELAVKILLRNLNNLIVGDYQCVPQPPANSSYYSRKSLDMSCTEINFNCSAYQVSSFVRAFYFPEYQTATLQGVRVRRCQITSERSTITPGLVVEESRREVVVSTIDYNVKLALMDA